MATATRQVMSRNGRFVLSSSPLRVEIAELSSGSKRGGYYNEYYHYLARVEELLGPEGLSTATPLEDYRIHNDDGFHVFSLYRGGFEIDTRLWISWHRMQSGRWEMVGYLS